MSGKWFEWVQGNRVVGATGSNGKQEILRVGDCVRICMDRGHTSDALIVQEITAPPQSGSESAFGATGSTDWPETPKGLNGPTGPAPSANEMMEGWRDGVLRPIAPTSPLDEANGEVAYWKWRYAERWTEIAELRTELTTLRARVAERDASVAWAIKRGR